MFNFVNITDAKGWFTKNGKDSDVVVSSRVRLARNLDNYTFPGFMKNVDETDVQDKVLSAFTRLSDYKNYTILYLDAISPLERRILMERNIITQEYSISKGKAVVLKENGEISAMINNEDHIRLSCIQSGSALREAYEVVNKIENELDGYLKFAFSLKLGYLSSNLTNLGTGIKVSLIVHLPALFMTSLINKALKAITQVGFSVKGFFHDGPSSLGNMYQLSNIITLGQTEEQIIESLLNVLQPLIEYERKAREELLNKKGIEFEDKIFRAYGILTQCRTITSREAIDLLSYIRLGIGMDIIKGISINKITSLLILCQKSHIQKIMSNLNEEKDIKMINYLRAKLIRENLL